jgi:hypothetical protein
VFIAFYNTRIEQGNKLPFQVVHGYGSGGSGGQIRTRLRKYLGRFPHEVGFERGEKLTGNPGVTVVIPFKALPTQEEGLAGELLEYCSSGKSEEKIIGKFRRYGGTIVKDVLRDLERRGKLVSFYKGKYRYYQISQV